jgi:hypothetical protein
MPNKCDAQFAVGDQLWFVSVASAGSNRRVPDEASELLCPLAQSRIAKSRFNHWAQ